MPSYLIGYDIAHPRRLRRVARALERRAVRVQYSVFLFRGDEAGLAALLNELEPLIRLKEDVIQAWQVPPGIPAEKFALGVVRPVTSAAVIVGNTTRFVENSAPPTPPTTQGAS